MPDSPPAPPKQKNWIERNWPWVVPSGCLLLIAVVTLFVVGLMAAVMGMIKSSDACQQAVNTALSNTRVIDALGRPIETGWFISGNINISGSSGEADLTIPLAGPNGKATLYAIGTRRTGQWEFNTLEVELKPDGNRINLLE